MYKEVTHDQLIGTSRIGILHGITGKEITAILGKPAADKNDLSHFEWNKNIDGHPVSIYDWHLDVCDREWVEDGNDEWSVGALGEDAIPALEKLFGNKFYSTINKSLHR